MVGIGASAGGLEAFSQLLKQLPTSTGMGFVLVQHLDPRHVSMLPELLASHTSMPVKQAAQGTRVEPDHVYVIPPNTSMSIQNGVLELTPRSSDRSRHLPIDVFLCSLAEDQKSRAVGVILSGSASDGTIGLEAIKAMGGVTFAQNESASFDSMPRNAIASGVVDFVLSPEAIAKEIGSLAGHFYMGEVKSEAVLEDGPVLQKILSYLQSRTGVAFTHYKRPTILRRLSRRMAMTHSDSLEAYWAVLEQRPIEVEALLDDLLITVTDFFRDPAVFDSLVEHAFPMMLKGRNPEDTIRVWVPGCASGKEVYSLAITLLEYLEATNQSFPIQIFGTDVSDRSIEVARAAKYPDSITETVSAARLKRFFVKLEHGYQIKRFVRELCIFSRQDVTKDPPLSKMDLVSCRNLLIYLEPVLQRRVLAILGYALRPSGCLLLGNSESLGTLDEHFIALDTKHKIFARNLELARPTFELPSHTPLPKNTSVAAPLGLDDATLLDLSADRLLLHSVCSQRLPREFRTAGRKVSRRRRALSCASRRRSGTGRSEACESRHRDGAPVGFRRSQTNRQNSSQGPHPVPAQ